MQGGTEVSRPFPFFFCRLNFCVVAAVIGYMAAPTSHAAPGDPPPPRGRHTAIWTGSKMVVWGGTSGSSSFFNDGGIYDPAANTWSAITTTGAPGPRFAHSAVWAGTQMIVWGGTTNGTPLSFFNDGGRFNLASGTWDPVTTSGAPKARYSHTAAWTGTKMVIWGGVTNTGYSGEGMRYDPTTDSWSTMHAASGFPRAFHTVIWSGTRVVMWGGYNLNGYLNYGVQYNPSTDSWGPFSTTINTPSPRQDHTAIWTGTEMIVWGGYGGSYRTNDGGRYNPATDTWGPRVPTNGAPSVRSLHSAVWTGSEMIVWGGRGNTAGSYLGDGGRYNPQSNTWAPVTTVGAPSPRDIHSAVWTGTEMIVWGGFGATGYLNDGGRYNPVADTWTALPTNAAVTLIIQRTLTDAVVVSWPSAASDRVLQIKTDVSAPGWDDVTQAPADDGTTKSIVIPSPTGTAFYRLR
jgi:N-acetylneuraminic acid mutarotase